MNRKTRRIWTCLLLSMCVVLAACGDDEEVSFSSDPSHYFPDQVAHKEVRKNADSAAAIVESLRDANFVDLQGAITIWNAPEGATFKEISADPKNTSYSFLLSGKTTEENRTPFIDTLQQGGHGIETTVSTQKILGVEITSATFDLPDQSGSRLNYLFTFATPTPDIQLIVLTYPEDHEQAEKIIEAMLTKGRN